jgi:hypothetical protein
MAGKGMGRAVAMLNAARDQISKLTDNTKLSEVREGYA